MNRKWIIGSSYVRQYHRRNRVTHQRRCRGGVGCVGRPRKAFVAYFKSPFVKIVNLRRKILQNRTNGSKIGPGIPPRRAFREGRIKGAVRCRPLSSELRTNEPVKTRFWRQLEPFFLRRAHSGPGPHTLPLPLPTQRITNGFLE